MIDLDSIRQADTTSIAYQVGEANGCALAKVAGRIDHMAQVQAGINSLNQLRGNGSDLNPNDYLTGHTNGYEQHLTGTV